MEVGQTALWPERRVAVAEDNLRQCPLSHLEVRGAAGFDRPGAVIAIGKLDLDQRGASGVEPLLDLDVLHGHGARQAIGPGGDRAEVVGRLEGHFDVQ